MAKGEIFHVLAKVDFIIYIHEVYVKSGARPSQSANLLISSIFLSPRGQRESLSMLPKLFSASLRCRSVAIKYKPLLATRLTIRMSMMKEYPKTRKTPMHSGEYAIMKTFVKEQNIVGRSRCRFKQKEVVNF